MVLCNVPVEILTGITVDLILFSKETNLIPGIEITGDWILCSEKANSIRGGDVTLFDHGI